MDFESDKNEDEFNLMNDDELFELLDEIHDNEKQIEIENKETTYCENCKSGDKIIEDRPQGIMVCMSCGSVIANLFDNNVEWKYNNDDSKNTVSRCGNITNFFFPQSSL